MQERSHPTAAASRTSVDRPRDSQAQGSQLAALDGRSMLLALADSYDATVAASHADRALAMREYAAAQQDFNAAVGEYFDALAFVASRAGEAPKLPRP